MTKPTNTQKYITAMLDGGNRWGLREEGILRNPRRENCRSKQKRRNRRSANSKYMFRI